MTTAFTYDALPQERVHFGKAVREALGDEVERMGAKRVFVATSKTLREKTGAISLIATTLGNKCAAIFDNIAEHSKLDGVLEAVHAARKANADLLVGVGGGSIIDGLKVVQLALSENVETMDQLLALANKRHMKPTPIRQVAIPTTLSGAETTPAGGGTDAGCGQKLGFMNPFLVPRAIIYDPALGALTPEWLWLSSAIRGVDHCCEGYLAKNVTPVYEAGLLHGLALFATSLRRTKEVPGDPFARMESQMASYLACSNSARAGSGASHGIGYILGGRYGLHHGHASCIMLPQVLRWNEKTTADRQTRLATTMGRPTMSAGDAVAELVKDLDLPSRLRDVGIKQDQLQAIADEAAKHPVVLSNPRPVTGATEVLEMLRAAW
ncbi:MAG: iron-containing alcohol dehydrogenase [Alphaproteobacteria bacterium]|nr:iron-containing alcohol dehydrogenase [Alphaproteobacteria bacterium]